MTKLHPIANYMQSFFYQYLASHRGLSTNTIMAYRDAIKLLLCFAAKYVNKKVDQINIEELDDNLILAFLDHVEKQRGCSVRTRNARLAAIRTFFGFIARKEPTLLEQCRKIRAIPQKRTEHKMIAYLENDEMQAILDSVESNSPMELRDKALLLFLYNSGARVQEVVDIKINDLRIDEPAQVKLLGKGKKQRACPLWPETAEAIKDYLQYRKKENPDSNQEQLFLNSNGNPITRFGIRYIIKKFAKKAAKQCDTLKDKVVSPHTFRHSTAMHLIQAGNDINMVKLWLGHADINTTHIYVEIDMEMKRKILDTCQSPTNNTEKNKTRTWQKPGILKWLNELSKKAKLCEVI